MITGALLANVAFIGLSSVFNYPDILQEPTPEIFQQYSKHGGVINLWFVLLALGAGLIAPIAVLLSYQFPGRLSRTTMWVGIAAAVVQVIGLLRWPFIVPTLIANGDTETFELLHTILGTIIGETLGYLFTGLWTILVVRNISGHFTRVWFSWFGGVAAGLILLGVFVPIGLPGADAANFIGYVLWSVWFIVFGILLLQR